MEVVQRKNVLCKIYGIIHLIWKWIFMLHMADHISK